MWKFLLIALVGHLALVSARPEDHDEHAATHPPPQCGQHEAYNSCASSSCAEATCDRPKVGPVCNLDCQHGCFCATGFYRNPARLCVTKDECPEDSAARTYAPPPAQDDA